MKYLIDLKNDLLAQFTPITADNILQIRAMIDAVKRLSAHYDVYLGYTLPAVIAAYAVPVVGVELTVST